MVDDETPLRSALQGLLDRYLTMVNSGDCGNWEPEDEAEVIAARKALKTQRSEGSNRRMIDCQQFIEIARVLTHIQEHEVPHFEGFKWRYFRADPFVFLMNADEEDARAIWAAVVLRLSQVIRLPHAMHDAAKATEERAWPDDLEKPQ